MRMDDVGPANGAANLWAIKDKRMSWYHEVSVSFPESVCAHSAGRAVPVRGSIAKEDAHFVNRYRLDLLPSTNPDQQLVQLQFVSVSVGK